MKTIQVVLLRWTNTKPDRLKAVVMGETKKQLTQGLSGLNEETKNPSNDIELPAKLLAEKLCAKLGWTVPNGFNVTPHARGYNFHIKA